MRFIARFTLPMSLLGRCRIVSAVVILPTHSGGTSTTLPRRMRVTTAGVWSAGGEPVGALSSEIKEMPFSWGIIVPDARILEFAGSWRWWDFATEFKSARVQASDSDLSFLINIHRQAARDGAHQVVDEKSTLRRFQFSVTRQAIEEKIRGRLRVVAYIGNRAVRLERT